MAGHTCSHVVQAFLQPSRTAWLESGRQADHSLHARHVRCARSHCLHCAAHFLPAPPGGCLHGTCLQVLCTTSTLAMGVNLPAHLVVLKGTVRWVGDSECGPGEQSGYKQYSQTEVGQSAHCCVWQGCDTTQFMHRLDIVWCVKSATASKSVLYQGC